MFKNIFSYSTLIDPLLRDLRQVVLEFSKVRKNEKVLDLGCGTGEQAILFAKKGAIVFGIDINPKMISQAIEKAKKEKLSCSFQIGDAEKLPFPDSSFDIVLTSLLLHEVNQKKREKIISEMKRVVKKEGRLIFVDFNFPPPKSLSFLFVRAIEFFAENSHYQNFKNYFEAGGLMKILERQKLNPEKIASIKNNLFLIIQTRTLPQI